MAHLISGYAPDEDGNDLVSTYVTDKSPGAWLADMWKQDLRYVGRRRTHILWSMEITDGEARVLREIQQRDVMEPAGLSQQGTRDG